MLMRVISHAFPVKQWSLLRKTKAFCVTGGVNCLFVYIWMWIHADFDRRHRPKTMRCNARVRNQKEIASGPLSIK
jgi:hypothetical protein